MKSLILGLTLFLTAALTMSLNCVNEATSTSGRIQASSGESVYFIIYIDNFTPYNGMITSLSTSQSDSLTYPNKIDYPDVVSNGIEYPATPEGYQCMLDTITALGLIPFAR